MRPAGVPPAGPRVCLDQPGAAFEGRLRSPVGADPEDRARHWAEPVVRTREGVVWTAPCPDARSSSILAEKCLPISRQPHGKRVDGQCRS